MESIYIYPASEEIVTRVLQVMDASIKRKIYGPWIVIVGVKIQEMLNKPYFTPAAKECVEVITQEQGENTVQARILRIGDMNGIVVDPTLPCNAIRLSSKVDTHNDTPG